MKTKKSNLVIVIFPYLFIQKKQTIDGLLLKPSRNEIIDEEKPLIKKQLLRIATFFRYDFDKQINMWSYHYAYLKSKKDWTALRNRLNRLSTILRFSQLSEPRSNALFSHFDYVAFQILPEQLDNNKEHYYYVGILNGENSLEFYIHNAKIDNPFSFHHVRSPFRCEDFEKNKHVTGLYEIQRRNSEEGKGLLKAIEWFNRSFASTGEVDEADQIIHLETAFEALFNTDRDGIKAQVQSGLIQFLGETVELKDWINQFWKLRCSIVHGDSELKPFWFKHQRGTKEHRHHVSMGRKIFTRCLETFLEIRASIYTKDIHEELISNEVRINKAKKLLQQQSVDSRMEAFDLISGLKHDEISLSKKSTSDFGKIFLPIVVKDLRDENKKEIADEINKILRWTGSDYGELALVYSAAFMKYRDFYFNSSYDIPAKAHLRTAGDTFLGYVAQRLLRWFD